MKDRDVEILLLRFNNRVEHYELPFFRGALVGLLGRENVLLHNHEGDGLRYAYPFVQYKRIGGRAALMCIDEGIKITNSLANVGNACVNIGHRENVELEPLDVGMKTVHIGVSEKERIYIIRKYLPFNHTNYDAYEKCESLVERYSMIERCLVGNIFSFAKSLGVFFEDRVHANILKVDGQHCFRFKGVKMLGFDLTVKTNVNLPDYIGLGGKVSFGYGTIVEQKEKQRENE